MACPRPLGKSCGFSKASFYLQSSVPGHATAHIHQRYPQAEKTTVNLKPYRLQLYNSGLQLH